MIYYKFTNRIYILYQICSDQTARYSTVKGPETGNCMSSALYLSLTMCMDMHHRARLESTRTIRALDAEIPVLSLVMGQASHFPAAGTPRILLSTTRRSSAGAYQNT